MEKKKIAETLNVGLRTVYQIEEHLKANEDLEDRPRIGRPCKKAQKWLEENLPGNVSFLPKELWPPYSPDLNPLDYSV
jgi:transposase